MNAKEARESLETLLELSPLCMAWLWFDGPCACASFEISARIGANEKYISELVATIEREDCGLPADFDGWAEVFVTFEYDPDPDWGQLCMQEIELLHANPAPKGKPIEDEPIPF